AVESGSGDAVATTGICRVYPGAVNSIPSQVVLEIDVRDTKLDVRDGMVAGIRGAAEEVCGRRGIGLGVEVRDADPPAACEPGLVAAVEESCRAAGRSFRRMVRRAYLDSLFMVRVARTVRIFIRCRDGVGVWPTW